MKKEHKISITLALSVIRKSKKSLSDLKDSVGPVSSTQQTLKKVEDFLEGLEKKEAKRLPKKRILFFSLVLLPPIKDLLLEFWVRAIEVIANFLWRN